MAGFCELAIGLRAPKLAAAGPKSPIVSGEYLEYSRFRETAPGDWFDPHCVADTADTEPKCRVDPNNGCASDDERHQIAHHTTSDPREEPGALAAHAGVWAGGGENSPPLPHPQPRAT